ncbi:MAG: histidine phosphatase family protein [Erysipelotrichaceae bacterium]|nr:histidine phosphatase family protein [Erysipelotrichaceae bacterium]
MKKLYLVRHGETLFNVRKIIQGWCDSPLTENGIQQAKKCGAYFRSHNITFDHAYSSTSERACDTLEFITDMPYIRTKGLKEMNYGIFEGEAQYLGAPNKESRETYYAEHGGTTRKEVGERMLACLTDIMNQEGHECVLAVSHGAANNAFLREVLGYQPGIELIMKNCSFYEFNYENGQFEFVGYVDTQVDE